MSDTKAVAQAEVKQNLGELKPTAEVDVDAAETQEWLSSLDYVLKSKGPERVSYLIEKLRDRAALEGVHLEPDTTTPYINTVPLKEQPALSSAGTPWRWWCGPTSAEAASAATSAPTRQAATLYEVGFNHFFRGQGEDGYAGDMSTSRATSRRASTPRVSRGRLTETTAQVNFRRELAPGRRRSRPTRTPG